MKGRVPTSSRGKTGDEVVRSEKDETGWNRNAVRR